jgi:hypothetical protein
VVVTGEYSHAVFFDLFLMLIVGAGHLYPERFGLIGPGNDAAIVIAEHHYGLSVQGRLEEALAGGIETVTVNDGFHDVFVCQTLSGFKP